MNRSTEIALSTVANQLQTLAFSALVVEESLAHVRTFLDNIANGTTDYRTIHSLNEQVEHQYHGRFAIELLQNAHDALRHGVKRGRVEFRLAKDEGSFGVLYAANDGRPFIEKDFRALSRLGQSSKDPEESIGNKGLGFRSVLEISNAPEIYSADPEGLKTGFRGFCFRFDPDVDELLRPAITGLASGSGDGACPFAPDKPLVSWPTARVDEFRRRVGEHREGWLEDELKLLSPYLLPLPIDLEDRESAVGRYEANSFSTLIRLPLKSGEALTKVQSLLQSLTSDETVVLFLDHLHSLTVATPGDEVMLRRDPRPRPDPLGGEEVTISLTSSGTEGGETPSDLAVARREFWCWSREFGGPGSPEQAAEIKQAARDLPGRWPEIRRAALAVAVEVCSDPLPGRYSIFLPTDVPTGVAAHFNAPFYAEIARRQIDFDQSVNTLFLRYLGGLVHDIVLGVLQGQGETEAAAIIDLLAPLPIFDLEAAGHGTVDISADGAKALRRAALFWTDAGWKPADEVRLLEPIPNARLLDSRLLREHSPFALMREEFRPRYEALSGLLECWTGRGGALEPTELARIVEDVAKALQKDHDRTQWAGFWEDLTMAFRQDKAALQGVRILLGADGNLHTPDGRKRLFFPPRRSGPVAIDPEVANRVPEVLASRIAFLTDLIPLYETRDEGGGIRANAIHGFLGTTPELVHEFDVEEILTEVILPGIPSLPAAHESPEAARCHDILVWSQRLLRGRETASITSKLGGIAVPTRGGWVRADEATFGPGWSTGGDDLLCYLEEAATDDAVAARDRLVLEPQNPVWSGLAEEAGTFLETLGVSRGLRLRTVGAAEWNPDFRVHAHELELPEEAPPGLDLVWQDYRESISAEVESSYRSSFTYRFEEMVSLPGLGDLENLTDRGRIALAKTILRSITGWPPAWKESTAKKLGGERHSLQFEAPIHFALRKLPWMASGAGDDRTFGPPSGFWLIGPDVLRAMREYQFRHLKPVAGELAELADPEVTSVLEDLGSPIYRPEEPTRSARLLEDLARSWADEAQEINPDRFVGQLRNAWRDFKPEPEDPLPSALVIRRRGSLRVRSGDSEDPFYLPDTAVSRLGVGTLETLDVLEIGAVDANRLAPRFEDDFGGRVMRLSRLRLEPVVADQAWSPPEGLELLRDSDLRWLLRPVLAVMAFHGPNAGGTETRRFREAVRRLRSARIFEASRIRIQILQDELVLSSEGARSWWDAENEILVVDRSNAGWLESLSRPLGRALDRADLDVALRLLLLGISEGRAPSDEEVRNALQRLGINDHDFRIAVQALSDDVSWIRLRARPAIRLLAPSADLHVLDRVDSLDELHAAIETLPDLPMSGEELIELCRSSATDRDLGRALYERQGDKCDLGAWNDVLTELGPPYEAFESEAVREDFEAHRLAAKAALHCAAREIARRAADPTIYVGLREDLEAVECPASYPSRFWSLSFQQACAEFCVPLQAAGATQALSEAVRLAQERDDLYRRLRAVGVDVETDPGEIQARNQNGCRAAFDRVLKLAVFWCAGNELVPPATLSSPDSLRGIEEWVGIHGWVESWSQGKCYRVVTGRLPRTSDLQPFWEIADTCADTEALATALGATEQQLEEAELQVRRLQAIEDRRKRLVQVSGADFDSDSENLGSLWEHIAGKAPNVEPLDLAHVAVLERIPDSSHQPGRSGGRSRSKSGERLTQRERDLIGLAGEIHAFRALRAQYGPTVVGSASWISSNGKYRFPQNLCDDSAGYDFRFTLDGYEYQIEVKATKDDSQWIDLGESQVRRAIEAAGRRSIRYLILRVTQALSTTPGLEVLPNPFDQRNANLFSFERSGMRLRYQRRSGAEGEDRLNTE